MSLHLELGKPFIFVLQSGMERKIIVFGQSSDGLWDIEADGVRGKYSDLQAAIGQPYTAYRAA